MKLARMTVEDFLRELASDSPTPGGGSAAALAGAVGASLCVMVARLTLGKETYRDSWQEMESLAAEAEKHAARLRELVDEDAQAYASVVVARRMLRGTAEERSARSAAVAEAVLRSVQGPLETLEILRGLAACPRQAVERGNPSCLTDAGSAAQMVRAAAMAAAYNVRVNLPDIADADTRERLRFRAAEALAAVCGEIAEIERTVDGRLG